MTSRFAVTIVALTVLLSALPWEVAVTGDTAPDVRDAAGDFSPLPDPGPLESDDPCSDDCPCLCCPGGPAFTLAQSRAPLSHAIDAQPLSGRTQHRPTCDVSRLIFHPPRLS
jgi:hypothetical protein